MEDWTDLFKKREVDELGEYIPENKAYSKSSDLSEEVNEDVHRKSIKKKFKKLKHKISYLNLEREEINNVFSHAKTLFIKNMFEYCKRKKIKAPFENYTPKKKKTQKADQQTNELYREIVKITHPDKTRDLSDEEIEERIELYREATLGKEDGDFNKVLGVALDLDVEIQDISPEMIKSIESEILKIEKKIRKIKSDVMYKWFYASPNDQQRLFEHLTKDQEEL
tara:strand:- start:16093 stop:16764 length:672 start_codon:yes stop_codon:yes gene_type:complete